MKDKDPLLMKIFVFMDLQGWPIWSHGMSLNPIMSYQNFDKIFHYDPVFNITLPPIPRFPFCYFLDAIKWSNTVFVLHLDVLVVLVPSVFQSRKHVSHISNHEISGCGIMEKWNSLIVYSWDNVITIQTTMRAWGPRNCSLISSWSKRNLSSSVSRLTPRPKQHTTQLVPSSICGGKATGAWN